MKEKRDEVNQKRLKVLPEVLEEIVNRIVEVAKPLRFILFGSAARGELGADSDIDMLVVVKGPVHRRELSGKIYRFVRSSFFEGVVFTDT